MWAFENLSSRKRKRFREKKLHGPLLGRVRACALRLVRSLASRPATALDWARKKRFTETQRRTGSIRSSSSRAPGTGRTVAGRVRPRSALGGRPTAGMGRRQLSAAVGGGAGDGDGLPHAHPSSRRSAKVAMVGKILCGFPSLSCTEWKSRGEGMGRSG